MAFACMSCKPDRKVESLSCYYTVFLNFGMDGENRFPLWQLRAVE